MSINTEVARRRTFAIISHPDAGKTTLTEKLLMFAVAIQYSLPMMFRPTIACCNSVRTFFRLATTFGPNPRKKTPFLILILI